MNAGLVKSYGAVKPFSAGRQCFRVKIGAKVVTHARYVIFQMAEVAVPKRLFRVILERIRRLRLPETVPR